MAREGQDDAAERLLSEVAGAASPVIASSALANLAVLRNRRGDAEGAVEACRQLLERYPGSYVAPDARVLLERLVSATSVTVSRGIAPPPPRSALAETSTRSSAAVREDALRDRTRAASSSVAPRPASSLQSAIVVPEPGPVDAPVASTAVQPSRDPLEAWAPEHARRIDGEYVPAALFSSSIQASFQQAAPIPVALSPVPSSLPGSELRPGAVVAAPRAPLPMSVPASRNAALPAIVAPGSGSSSDSIAPVQAAPPASPARVTPSRVADAEVSTIAAPRSAAAAEVQAAAGDGAGAGPARTSHVGDEADLMVADAERACQAGNWAEAFALLDRALTLRPGHTPALFNVAAMHFERRDFALAAAAFDRYLAFRPGDFEARLYAGICAQQIGRPWDARYHLLRAEKIRPGHPEVARRLAAVPDEEEPARR